MRAVTIKWTEFDGRDWYLINGYHRGFDVEFKNDNYAVTNDGKYLDYEGYPLSEGDERSAVISIMKNYKKYDCDNKGGNT